MTTALLTVARVIGALVFVFFFYLALFTLVMVAMELAEIIFGWLMSTSTKMKLQARKKNMKENVKAKANLKAV